MKMAIIITSIGMIVGAAAGWLYWKYIGCTSGTCPITSRPLSSTLYGAMIGALLFYSFTPVKKTQGKSQQQTEIHDKHA